MPTTPTSPLRKGLGLFNTANITTEESLYKYSKKIIKPIDPIEKHNIKQIRTFTPLFTDSILHSYYSNTENKFAKKDFEPSQELQKYNEKKAKIPRKISVSPLRSKNLNNNFPTPPPKVKTLMEFLLQSPFHVPDELTVNPQCIPFKDLKRL